MRGADGFDAYNTDYQGVLDSLQANLPDPAARTATAADDCTARAACWSWEPAAWPGPWPTPCITRRRMVTHHQPHPRAQPQKLAEEVGCRSVDWAARHNVICDMLINCTSVGMHPNVDETPSTPAFSSRA